MSLTNLHVLTVKYMGASNYRNARVSITSYRFKQSITIPWDDSYNSIRDVASAFLKRLDFKLVAEGELDATRDVILSSTFKGPKDALNELKQRRR